MRKRGQPVRFLDTNQVGFDPAALGFPSVQSCQALVYQTDIGLFGFHASSSSLPVHEKKCDAFALFVQNRSIAHAGAVVNTRGVCVIGVITRYERFGDKQGTKDNWGNELTAFADALGFTGNVYGIQVSSHVDKNESIYVRFDWVANARCKVRYKRWTKMDYYQAGVGVGDPERRNLAPDPNSVVTPLAPHTDWIDKQPLAPEQDVHRKGLTDEGSLHTLSWFDFKKFR
jgi:hypothetical protein